MAIGKASRKNQIRAHVLPRGPCHLQSLHELLGASPAGPGAASAEPRPILPDERRARGLWASAQVVSTRNTAPDRLWADLVQPEQDTSIERLYCAARSRSLRFTVLIQIADRDAGHRAPCSEIVAINSITATSDAK
jgi:hypothetical protein